MGRNVGAGDFEQIVLAHLDAAHNLARWLMRSDHDAQDAVQEAIVRALRSFDTFRGGDSRAWLLTIVRNTCFNLLRSRKQLVELDEQVPAPDERSADPQTVLLRAADAERVRRAIDSLPADLRSTLVLRELEGLSYKEVAQISGVPIGTVMSRLSRSRQRLASMLASDQQVGEVA